MKPVNKLSLTEYLDRAHSKHGFKYDYSQVIYAGLSYKIKIVCPDHGLFEQVAESHLKYGCRLCGNVTKGKARAATLANKLEERTGSFFETVRKTHGTTYDYSKSQFVDVRLKITITCPKHGDFEQVARTHASGSGCQKCAKESSTSKPEQAWLDSLGIKTSDRNQIVVAGSKKLSVDAYVAASNTVYEFWGDYWHGNPNCAKSSASPKAEERYRKTLAKIELIKTSGFNLVQIWESDWKISNSQ
jgi:hypothetical protein